MVPMPPSSPKHATRSRRGSVADRNWSELNGVEPPIKENDGPARLPAAAPPAAAPRPSLREELRVSTAEMKTVRSKLRCLKKNREKQQSVTREHSDKTQQSNSQRTPRFEPNETPDVSPPPLRFIQRV